MEVRLLCNTVKSSVIINAYGDIYDTPGNDLAVRLRKFRGFKHRGRGRTKVFLVMVGHVLGGIHDCSCT